MGGEVLYLCNIEETKVMPFSDRSEGKCCGLQSSGMLTFRHSYRTPHARICINLYIRYSLFSVSIYLF